VLARSFQEAARGMGALQGVRTNTCPLFRREGGTTRIEWPSGAVAGAHQYLSAFHVWGVRVRAAHVHPTGAAAAIISAFPNNHRQRALLSASRRGLSRGRRSRTACTSL